MEYLNTNWEELQRGDIVILLDDSEVICGYPHNNSFRAVGKNTTYKYEDAKGFINSDDYVHMERSR